METAYIFLFVLILLCWICYQLQKKIGEEQSRDWEDWKKANPQYFKKVETESVPPIKGRSVSWTEEEVKKFMEEMWARHHVQHSFPDYNGPKNDIRQK